MDKLKLAHDYALKQMESLSENSTMQSLVSVAWKYADAMQAEGVSCIRTWAYIAVETPFKSKADYSYFVQEKALRLMLGEMVA